MYRPGGGLKFFIDIFHLKKLKGVSGFCSQQQVYMD